MTPPQSQAFAVPRGDISLVGERWPGEKPTIVLLHAGVTDRRCWEKVAATLAGPSEVVTYDCRGYGESAPAPGPFSHLDDLFAVLNEVGGGDDGEVWLVGSSMGGRIALDAALAAPRRVAGLVLLAPGVSGAPRVELDPDTRRLEVLLDAAEAEGDLLEVARLLTWIWLDGPREPEGRVTGPARDLTMDMIGVILRNAVPQDTEKSELNAWNGLGEIRVPALIACGDRDLPHVAERSRHLADRLPRGYHRGLPGMAHLPYMEDPILVAGLVARAVAAA